MANFSTTHFHRAEVRGTAALAAVALLIDVAFGLSTLITPLYLLYQQQFGFSQVTLTLIYAAYVIGNLTALLFFGGIADRVGRRLAALSAIITLIVAALVFLFAKDVGALYIGRVLTGLGVGIASGTGDAWLAELVGRVRSGGADLRACLPGLSRSRVVRIDVFFNNTVFAMTNVKLATRHRVGAGTG